MKGVLLFITFLGFVFGLEAFLSNSDMSLLAQIGCFIFGSAVIFTAFRFSPFKG